MSEKFNTVSQNIIDWCQQDGISCVHEPENLNMSWALQVGGTLVIYTTLQHSERIYFQSQINFAEIHRALVNQTWNNNQRNVMMFNLKKLVAQLDVLMNFQLINDELTGFHTYKIHDHATISKADFLEKYRRVQAVHEIVLNQLNLELGIALQKNQSNQNLDKTNTGR
jgi:hypothetical protein